MSQPSTSARLSLNRSSPSAQSQCEIANKNPKFQYLIRQLDLRRFEIAMRTGFVSPTRHYIPKESYFAPKSSRTMGLEEVFLTLVRKAEENTTIRWQTPVSIMLVFSLALLERDDYYLSLRDQYGDMTGQSYSRKYIAGSNKIKPFPDINFDPEILSAHSDPNLLVKYAANEVVFKEEIPIKYITEVWIPGSGSTFISYTEGGGTVIRDKVLGIIKKYTSRLSLTFQKQLPVLEQAKYPIRSAPNLKLCTVKDIQDSKKYKASFCRSTRSMYNRVSMDNPEEFRTHHWQSAVPLSTTKKIAINCGIDPGIVNRTNNPDILDQLILEKEEEELEFLQDNYSEKNPRAIDAEYRKRYLGKYVFEPPFTHQPFSDGRPDGMSDREIDIQSPFYEIVDFILAFVEFELDYAIKNKQFAMTKQEVIDHVSAFEEQYHSVNGWGRTFISDLLSAYFEDSIGRKESTKIEMFQAMNDLVYLFNDKDTLTRLASEIRETGSREGLTFDDLLAMYGSRIVSEIKRLRGRASAMGFGARR